MIRVVSIGSILMVCACGSEGSSASGSAVTPTADATAKSTGAKADTTGGDMVSCNSPKESMCSEWRGLDAEEKKDAKGSCNEPGSVFGTAACPSEKLLGTCDHKAEKIRIFVYPSEVIKDAKGAKELCDDGVFTAAKK